MASRKTTPDVLGELLSGTGAEPLPAVPAVPAPAPAPARRARTPKKDAPAKHAAPPPAAAEVPPLPQWDYLEVLFRDYRGWRTHTVNGRELGNWKTSATLVDYVKQLGDEGWEMVSMSDERHNQKEAYFKRPRRT